MCGLEAYAGDSLLVRTTSTHSDETYAVARPASAQRA